MSQNRYRKMPIILFADGFNCLRNGNGIQGILGWIRLLFSSSMIIFCGKWNWLRVGQVLVLYECPSISRIRKVFQ